MYSTAFDSWYIWVEVHVLSFFTLRCISWKINIPKWVKYYGSWVNNFAIFSKEMYLAPSHVSRRLFEYDKRLEWVNHFPVGDKWVMTDPHEPLNFKINNPLSRIRHRKPTTRGRLVLSKLPWNRTGIPLWIFMITINTWEIIWFQSHFNFLGARSPSSEVFLVLLLYIIYFSDFSVPNKNTLKPDL